MSARLRSSAGIVAVPLVVALLAVSWVLWTRGDPERQGGYCANASIEIATVLARSVDLSTGATPPVEDILAQVEEVDVERFAVDTPADIADAVAELRAERSVDAFARIIIDYLDRCGNPS